MTARAWVQTARPEAPAALTRRVLAVLDEHPEWDTLPTADALGEAGQALLRAVVARQAAAVRDRSNALDLLAADACVTWAFEAASDAPAEIGERAQATMQRIFQVEAG